MNTVKTVSPLHGYWYCSECRPKRIYTSIHWAKHIHKRLLKRQLVPSHSSHLSTKSGLHFYLFDLPLHQHRNLVSKSSTVHLHRLPPFPGKERPPNRYPLCKNALKYASEHLPANQSTLVYPSGGPSKPDLPYPPDITSSSTHSGLPCPLRYKLRPPKHRSQK